MAEAAQLSPGEPLHLKKVLTLWDLIFYGLVLIQPTAPIPLFGVAQKLSNGHTVTAILVAMLAMVLLLLITDGWPPSTHRPAQHIHTLAELSIFTSASSSGGRCFSIMFCSRCST